MSTMSIIKEAISILLRYFFKFLMVIILYIVIMGILESIAPKSTIDVFDYPSENITFTNIFNSIRGPGLNNMTSFSFDILKNIISNILIGANFMAILDLLRGYSYGVGEVKDKIMHYYPVLIPVAAIYTLVLKILGLVPIIGSILVMIAYFALLFIYFLVEDYPELNPMDYLKLSYEITNGHKLKLVFLWIMIMIVPIILAFIILFLLIPSLLIGGLAAAVIVIPIFMIVLIPTLATTTLMMIAITIYYERNIIKI